MPPPSTTLPRVSIIVRTKDEELWVGHCLEMVFKQDYPDFEVIVVDNQSMDHTLAVVRRYPVQTILGIRDYKPGLALNMGIDASTGSYIACLSAHCIPRTERWLQALVGGFLDATIAGVYGRQLPLAFSSVLDKRDLITVFGLDRRVQTKDYFFHNANSVIRREVWERYRFDETLANIEDRHWGKTVIDAGYRLVYEPDAAVYHHHGINQDDDFGRASGVAAVLDLVDKDVVADLPDSLKPENCNVAAVAPVLGEPRDLQGYDLLSALLRDLKEARYVRTVHAFGESEAVRLAAGRVGAKFIARPRNLLSRERKLGEILQYVLGQIEAREDYPQTILYANYLHPFRPPRLFDELVTEQQYKGLDAVFPAYVDYSDHWFSSKPGAFERVTEAVRPGPDKPRLYRSLYGLGCAIRASIVRRGNLIGGKVGVLPIHDHIHTLRCADAKPEPKPPLVGNGPSPLGWTSELFLREFRP